MNNNMDESGVNRSVVIFLLTICVISLGLGIFANYRLIKINRDNNKQVEKKKEEKKKKDNNVITKNEDNTKELIMDKQIVLNNYTSSQYLFKDSQIYEKDSTNEELDSSKKLVAVLYTLSFDKRVFESINEELYPNIKLSGEGTTSVIPAIKVKELYNDVFGEELDTSISLPETVAKNFSYNSEYDVYVEYGGFGGTCSNSTLTYDYDYKKEDNKYYVYTAVAYEYECPYSIYKNPNKQDQYEYDGDSFELNDKNYKDFNQYKITYVDNNGNYVFEKIEKIK